MTFYDEFESLLEKKFDGLTLNSMPNSEDREEYRRKYDRAQEIASGITMGTFERDEEVWELVTQIKDKK